MYILQSTLAVFPLLLIRDRKLTKWFETAVINLDYTLTDALWEKWENTLLDIH